MIVDILEQLADKLDAEDELDGSIPSFPAQNIPAPDSREKIKQAAETPYTAPL